MEKKLFLIMLIMITSITQAQVGIGTTNPSPNSILEINSSSKGLMIPRMTTLQRKAIDAETTDESLLVFDTDTKSMWYWTGTKWHEQLNAEFAGSFWKAFGNDDVANENFVGTLGEQDLVIKTNNSERMRILYNGNIGLGTNNADKNAIIDFNGTNSGSLGVKLPYVTTVNRDLIDQPVKGLTIYNTTEDCIEVYIDNTKGWFNPCKNRYSNLEEGTIATFTCASASITGSFYDKVRLTSNTLTIPYTLGNGGRFDSSTFYSTGVTGVIASIQSGILANGNGTLVFTLTGTPSTTGTGTIVINMFGQTCTKTFTVTAGGTVLSLDNTSNTGTVYAGYSASGASVVLNYSGANGASYTAQSVNSSDVTGLTANLTNGVFATGNGSVTLTITGIANKVGNASFTINLGGKTKTFTFNVTAYTSCKNYKTINPSASDGLYKIDPDLAGSTFGLVDCQCDMTTDGGGWTLILNYVHRRSITSYNSIRSNSLPLIGSSSLGADESGNATYWGHLSNAALNAFPSFSEVRIYGISSNDVSKVIHFKTSNSNVINYFRTGSGSCNGINSSFSPLSSHNSNIPANANSFYSDKGNYAMVDSPFYTFSSGYTCLGNFIINKWEASDWNVWNDKDTIHRIWIK